MRCTPVQRQLSHHQHAHVVRYSYIADTFSICELMCVHDTHNHDRQVQCVAHSEPMVFAQDTNTVTEHWRLKIGMPGCDSKKRVDGAYKDDDLCYKGQVVVDEATLLARVECRPRSFVHPALVESSFEDVLADKEEDNQKLHYR